MKSIILFLSENIRNLKKKNRLKTVNKNVENFKKTLKKNRKSLNKKVKKMRKYNESEGELEHLTTELIDETEEYFRDIIKKQLDPDGDGEMCFERDSLNSILICILDEIVARRTILIGRIEKDVETGNFYDRYYSKMQVINTLTNNAYAKMQKLELIEASFEREKEIYEKVIGRMYDFTFDDTKKKNKMGRKRQDVLEIMDKKKKMLERSDDIGQDDS